MVQKPTFNNLFKITRRRLNLFIIEPIIPPSKFLYTLLQSKITRIKIAQKYRILLYDRWLSLFQCIFYLFEPKFLLLCVGDVVENATFFDALALEENVVFWVDGEIQGGI